MMANKERTVHPMVAVPDAIHMVLRQTAMVILTKGSTIERVAAGNWKKLQNETLARDVTMAEPGYPPYNASIMDGYAIIIEEYNQTEGNWTHNVLGKRYAGDDVQHRSLLPSDEPSALYVTTGAVVPDPYNCVVPIEECEVSPDKKRIRISKDSAIKDGIWIRRIGCDMLAGSVVLPRGHKLDPIALGLLQQSGVQEVEIHAKLNVGVLSTGNELRRPGDNDQGEGRIPDVNRPILLSLLSTFGTCKPIDLGMARDDDVCSLTQTIKKSLDICDVIITTGGISMGETDVVEHVLVEQLGGKLHFGRMHMKPGKPTTFVTIHDKLVFAMPGNPVSATVCTQLLVKPCLDLLYSGTDQTVDTKRTSLQKMVEQVVSNASIHPEVQANLMHDIKLDKGRPEYHRVILREENGLVAAISTGVQRSSRLMSMLDAQGLLLLPQATSEKTIAKAGESYTVLMLSADPMKCVSVRTSVHLQPAQVNKEFRIGVYFVMPEDMGISLSGISARVSAALSGTNSGTADVAESILLTSFDPSRLFDLMASDNGLDLCVVICAACDGSFRFSLDFSAKANEQLHKAADSLTLQTRRGAASQDPAAGIFEVVVGYLPRGKGSMLICLPEKGMDSGLKNVRGLLNHALKVARGQNTHQH